MKIPLDKLTPAQYSARRQQSDLNMKVKALLCSAGVPLIWMNLYNCFARELDKLVRMEVTGESFIIETRALIQKWAAQGLSPAILKSLVEPVTNRQLPDEGT